ncbi:hypothetical protein Q669_27950 [Labrenzia sp. C1B10]|nr:hypothetical protein Q669_27950 [Labrenzia sp. C1B10]ERS03551.1 hypothetical protein Q675_31255 [Labrenzia sp. C1B70]
MAVRSKGLAVADGDEAVLLGSEFGDMVDVVCNWEMVAPRLRSAIASTKSTRLSLDALDLAPPISRFRRDVLCTGWNYWDHFEEGRDLRPEIDRPEAPTFFTKSPDSIIGPYDPIAYDPRVSSKWDYEAELVLVIGRTGRNIPTTKAFEHVFGYCLGNDTSARDLQFRHGTQWTKGKGIDNTTPLGPTIITADELDLDNLRLECVVNDELRQSASIKQMAFAIPEIIAELSFGMTLHAGDVVFTGTPAGVGQSRKPPVFLRDGDLVVVRGSGLGELRNRVTKTDLYGDTDLQIISQ